VGISSEQIGTVVKLLQVGNWLEGEIDRRLRSEAGVSHAEYEVLMQLLQHGHRLTMKELSELSLFSQSGITRVVDRLVQKGLVRRDLPAKNRRVVYAVLSPAGEDLLERRAMPLVRKTMTELVSQHLSVENARTFDAILVALLRGNGWWDERQVPHRSSA
jgi:DNA-binding MarR family transcriptional regulator